MLLFVFAFERDSPEVRVYKTDVGSQLTVQMATGVHATLNTNTKIYEWKYYSQWHSELLEGESLFDVKDTNAQQMHISVCDLDIAATHGEFAVRMYSDRCQIIVTAGSAAISSSHLLPVALYRNQQAVFQYSDYPTRLSISILNDSEIRKKLSWRYGALQFSHDLIGDAVSELNRYNRIQVQLSGSEIENMKIDGLFRSNDPLAFAATVRTLDPNISLAIDDSRPNQTVLRLGLSTVHIERNHSKTMRHQGNPSEQSGSPGLEKERSRSVH